MTLQIKPKLPRGLRDEDILNISQRLHDRNELTELGMKLQVEEHAIEACFTNHSNDIRTAAHQILRIWRKSVDPSNAYDILGQALLEAKQDNIAKEILGYP